VTRPRRIVLSLAAIALVVAAWLAGHWWQADSTRGDADSTAAAQTPTIASALSTRATADSRPNPNKTAEAERESAATPESRPAPAESALAEVRGQVVRDGGAAAVGLAVELGAWPPDPSRALSQYSQLPLISMRGAADAEGRFRFRFAPSPGLAFWVKGSGLGLEPFEWRCMKVEPGDVRDLGVITLRTGGIVSGRLIDTSGRPLDSDWFVDVRSLAPALGSLGFQSTVAKVPVDAQTGAFRVEGAPLGRVSIGARLQAGQKSPVFYVVNDPLELLPGQERRVDLSFDGSRLASRIRVMTWELPALEMVKPEHVTIRGAGIAPRQSSLAAASPGGTGESGFFFYDLPAGHYTVEIHHPAYLPWKSEGAEPGPAILKANLVGNANVVLRVLDDAGRPVDRFGADVSYSLPWLLEKERARFRWEDDPPAPIPWSFPMVPLDKFTLTVFRGNGAEMAEAIVEKLAPGETREVTIHFEKTIPQMWFAGRVFEADGATPAAGEIVGIFAPAEEQDSAASAYLAPPVTSSSAARCRTRIAEAHTNEEGIFQSPRLRPGRYFARVVRGAGLEVMAEVELRTGEEAPEPRLVLPRGAFVEGRLKGMEGSALAGARVRAGVLDANNSVRRDLSRALAPLEAEASVAADGAYRVGPLPPGRVRLSLILGDGAPRELATLDIVGNSDAARDFDLKR
jgi:hypothetical protein